MPDFGTRVIFQGGRWIGVVASGSPRYKTGGITLDWTTVTAVSSDTTLTKDGRVVLNGQSYIEMGTVLCKITASGKYGPYASGASDGRQTLARGQCYILNRTIIKEQDLHSDHPSEVFDGIVNGAAYVDRIASDGTNGISTNPNRATLNTAFPELTWFEN